jgi:hypothetical protein
VVVVMVTSSRLPLEDLLPAPHHVQQVRCGIASHL